MEILKTVRVLISDFEFILEKQNLDLFDYYKYSFAFFVGFVGIFILVIFLLLSLIFSFVFVYLIFIYLEDNKQRKISAGLSDLLVQASLFPKGTDLIEIIKYFGNNAISNENLSHEFRICYSQILAGVSVTDALVNIQKRNKNEKLAQIVNYLKISYDSGIEVSELFGKLSKNLINAEIVEKEKQVGLSIQKYTLITSSALIVPLVLKWVLNIVTGFSANSAIDAFSFNSALLDTAKIAIYAYVGELSLITSIFVGIIDGNWKKFVVYFCFICPLAYLVFILA